MEYPTHASTYSMDLRAWCVEKAIESIRAGATDADLISEADRLEDYVKNGKKADG